MADFTLARESIKEVYDYPVEISEFETNYEQRRLKTANPIVGFEIETPILTYTKMKAYRDFFISKFGALTSFTIVNPFDTTTWTVRFVVGSFQIVYQTGFYKATFQLKSVT